MGIPSKLENGNCKASASFTQLRIRFIPEDRSGIGLTLMRVMRTSRMKSWPGSCLQLLLLASWATSCSSTPTANSGSSVPRVGWQVREGQAIWHPGRTQPEIAGELVTGVRGTSDRLVEFVKTPFPLVIAKSSAAGWDVRFGPDGPRFSGRGAPPDRWIWFHLRDCLEGRRSPPPGWTLNWPSQDRWHLENRSSGESLEGYLRTSTE
jgi:hypothetical protein